MASAVLNRNIVSQLGTVALLMQVSLCIHSVQNQIIALCCCCSCVMRLIVSMYYYWSSSHLSKGGLYLNLNLNSPCYHTCVV